MGYKNYKAIPNAGPGEGWYTVAVDDNYFITNFISPKNNEKHANENHVGATWRPACKF